jgi:hypothetical protein
LWERAFHPTWCNLSLPEKLRPSQTNEFPRNTDDSTVPIWIGSLRVPQQLSLNGRIETHPREWKIVAIPEQPKKPWTTPELVRYSSVSEMPEKFRRVAQDLLKPREDQFEAAETRKKRISAG